MSPYVIGQLMIKQEVIVFVKSFIFPSIFIDIIKWCYGDYTVLIVSVSLYLSGCNVYNLQITDYLIKLVNYMAKDED